ncbi:retrovirus-related pol polyprotein from transposon TNT 1-94 [Tanacetum coccineum]
MALNRSKSRYSIKECSTCGSWYTKECCSIGNLKDQIIVPVSDSFQHCAVCGTPVDGPYCHGCTRIRTKFEKDLFTYCVDNGVFQNLQDTPESSNDNTNVVNAPREPSVVDQDPDSSGSKYGNATCSSGTFIESMTMLLDEVMIIPLMKRASSYLLCGGEYFENQAQLWKERKQFQLSICHELLQSLLNDLQILNEIQPLKQEIPNQIQKDQRKKIEDMSIEEIMHEQQLVDREIKEIINDLGYKRFRGEEIDKEYERDCEIRIQKLKQDFNIWGSEVRKKEKAYEDEKYAAACRYMLSVTCDDDDDDNLGFYAVHPNTIHIPVSQNVEPKDSLIMGDEHINITPETETNSVETLVSNPRRGSKVSRLHSKSSLTLDIFDHPPTLNGLSVTKAFSGSHILLEIFSKKFSGFWKLMVQYGALRTKQFPHVAIDGLQISLQKWENFNLILKSVVRDTIPQTCLAAEWEFELRTPVVVAISYFGRKAKYKWEPKSPIRNVNTNVSMPLGNASRTANILEPMTPRCSTVSNTPFSSNSFAARTVKFGNDQIAPILGYGDLGNDLLTGSHRTNLYSITLQDTSTPNPICLMAKATSSQAWLWHRRRYHLNFDTINLLSKNNIVTGLPKLKFVKDHLCSSCELGKAKRKSFHTNTTPSSKRRLQFLHMDLCGPMRVENINGKKYVLVIVDDYSRYTWTHFLRSKDETPAVLIDFLTLV